MPLNEENGETAYSLPNSKLITEAWKTIDIKSITGRVFY